MAKKASTIEKKVRQIRRKSRKQYSGDEQIRIVLDGLRGEETVSELCRREGIEESMYYRWSKEFLEAGKAGRRLCRCRFRHRLGTSPGYLSHGQNQ